MIINSRKYDYPTKVVSVSGSVQIEPDLIKNDIDYYSISKPVAKIIAKNTGMKSLQFSKGLYKLDSATWVSLLTKQKSDFENSKNFYNNAKYLISDNEVKSILWNCNSVQHYLEILKGYLDSEYEVLLITDTKDDTIRHIIMLDDKHGVELTYYLNYNELFINRVYYVESTYIVSTELVSGHLVSEDSELIVGCDTIMPMISDDLILGTCRNISEVSDLMSNTNLAVSELISYLKSAKIKLSEYINEEGVSDLKTRLLDMKVPEDDQEYYYQFLSKVVGDDNIVEEFFNNWLVQAISFTSISFLELVNFLQNINDVNRDLIHKICHDCLNKNANIFCIKDNTLKDRVVD